MILRVLLLGLLMLTAPARADAEVVLVLGDSLSAGYGIDMQQSWVSLLGQRLVDYAPGYRVVNASISGDTSRTALSRLPAALARYQPTVVIVEVGGNDGLQGLPLGALRDNLNAIVATARKHGAQVLLLGMRLPPNYGPLYTERFHAIYQQVAKEQAVPLVPFLLNGVGGEATLMQGDGIHPTAEAQARLLDNVWPHLVTLLRNI